VSDEPRVDLCTCDHFVLWYVQDEDGPPLPVCRCGHPDVEHIELDAMCIGTLVQC
jgi:hypothetical protein